jgi:hypothetical protein
MLLPAINESVKSSCGRQPKPDCSIKQGMCSLDSAKPVINLG